MEQVDEGSNCEVFVDCLRELRRWSDAHPRHLPVFVLVQPQAGITLPGPPNPVPFTTESFDALDAEIRSVMRARDLVVPDRVRGSHPTLEAAVLAGGWPTLAAARGKFVFLLDQGREVVRRRSPEPRGTGHVPGVDARRARRRVRAVPGSAHSRRGRHPRPGTPGLPRAHSRRPSGHHTDHRRRDPARRGVRERCADREHRLSRSGRGATLEVRLRRADSPAVPPLAAIRCAGTACARRRRSPNAACRRPRTSTRPANATDPADDARSPRRPPSTRGRPRRWRRRPGGPSATRSAALRDVSTASWMPTATRITARTTTSPAAARGRRTTTNASASSTAVTIVIAPLPSMPSRDNDAVADSASAHGSTPPTTTRPCATEDERPRPPAAIGRACSTLSTRAPAPGGSSP